MNLCQKPQSTKNKLQTHPARIPAQSSTTGLQSALFKNFFGIIREYNDADGDRLWHVVYDNGGAGKNDEKKMMTQRMKLNKNVCLEKGEGLFDHAQPRCWMMSEMVIY